MQKSVLITGSSSGIGYAAAHYMRDQGWRVFASCRQESDCEKRKEEGFSSPKMDYDDPNSLRTGLDEILHETGGTLDAVFNNGAFACPGLAEDLPRDALRSIFETNVFGVHDLTRMVIPVMRAQGGGRIVQCSSVLGFTPAQARAAYVSSKFALEGLTRVLRLELANDPIDAILIQPGPISSKIRINAQPHFEKWIDVENSAKRDFYEKAFMPRLYDNSGKKDKFELPALAVAKKLHHALNSTRPKPRYFVTTPTYVASWVNRLLPMGWQEKIFMRG